ncbi:PLP-dependent aminotransferase family protein [Acidobacteriota bacterium]
MMEPYDPLASVQAAGPPGTISFIYGLPDTETFPITELKRCYERVFEENSELALQYAPEQGYGPLIDFLRDKMQRDEGIRIERSQITLTGGAAQGLDHLCTMLTSSGDTVLVEAPTYRDSLALLRNHGLELIGIPTDKDGLVVSELISTLDSLDKRGKKPRFLYTVPTFQNPAGLTLTEERRRTLIALAANRDLLIVEDDVYFDIAFKDIEVTPLFTLAMGKKVIRLGSFSKIIAPGLRLGWVSGPPEIIDKLIQSGLRCMGGGANPVTANAISFFCNDGHLESHLTKVKPVYKQRRDVMVETLHSTMPAGVSWTEPDGGFFVWLTLPDALPSVDVVKWGKEAGVWFPSGDLFFAGPPPGQHLRMAFSYVQPENIRKGIERLAQVIKDHL